LPLGTVRQKAGKTIQAWAFEGDVDPTRAKSNLFPMHTSTGWRQAPEIDRYGWFSAADARQKLNPAQAAFVDRLEAALSEPTD
jgi:predicted NUDIX family NTP pyrophosphohydrolase